MFSGNSVRGQLPPGGEVINESAINQLIDPEPIFRLNSTAHASHGGGEGIGEGKMLSFENFPWEISVSRFPNNIYKFQKNHTNFPFIFPNSQKDFQFFCGASRRETEEVLIWQAINFSLPMFEKKSQVKMTTTKLLKSSNLQ